MAAIIDLLTVRFATVDMRKGILLGTAKLETTRFIFFLKMEVSKGAKIRNRYNQVPHPTQDTNGKVTYSQ